MKMKSPQVLMECLLEQESTPFSAIPAAPF